MLNVQRSDKKGPMKIDNFNFGLLPSGCVFGWVWWPSGCCGENIANNASDASFSPHVNVVAVFVHHAYEEENVHCTQNLRSAN